MIDFLLYIQSSYSFNGSLIDPSKLVQRARTLGYQTLALTDRKVLSAAIKFTESCLKVGIQPILGMEITVQGLFNHETPLLLYAKNEVGYQSLLTISSHLNTSQEPLTIESLAVLQDGLKIVALTHQGDFYDVAKDQDYVATMDITKQYQTYFKEFFIGLDFSDESNATFIAPWYESNPLAIVCNHVLYESIEDKEAATILAAIVRESQDPTTNLFSSDTIDCHLLTREENLRRYEMIPQTIKQTQHFLKDFQWALPLGGRHLPRYPLEGNQTANLFLRQLANKGLQRRYAQKSKPLENFQKYQNRLNFELDMIQRMGYEDYFLIVWDFVLYAKRNHILVGPGRGSAAGSLVSYVLGIVDVDPLEHGLFFERFLNPERITMPDIDMDFPDDRRDEVIRYVVDKYGKDHVVNIVAFGTFQGKSAIRDVGRILQLPDLVLSEISDYVNQTDNSLEKFLETQPEKVAKLRENPEIDRLFNIAVKLVDLPKHIGTHAAGIIITDQPITLFSPVQNGLLEMYQTQYEATDLEKIGLNKIDFLGIRNLKTIQRVIELVKDTNGVEIDIYKIPMDDAKTFALLQQVYSLGVFQLESDGMMNLMRKMQLATFEDISLCIALFRPGPMENIPSYLRRRFQEEAVDYIHPILEPILSSTKGIIVYQEQIMQIAGDFAGYSLGEADVLRRAVSKKNETTLLLERQTFVKKATALGRDEAVSNHIYDLIVKFANYGFNKSHSVAYALVAYWMAYLKANHATAFMAVLMDSVAGSQAATSEYMKECRRLGIKILPPAINRSGIHYHLEEGNLRYPYIGIRSIGYTLAKRVSDLQEEGEIHSFIEFIKRAKDLNIRAIESLIMAGVFDAFSQTKRTLIENLKQVLRYVELSPDANPEGFIYIDYPEYPFAELRQAEKDLLGIHLQYHTIQPYYSFIEQKSLRTPSDCAEHDLGPISLLGVIQKIRTIKTKNQETMAFIDIEDEFQSLDGVLFPKTYHRYGVDIEVGRVYILEGVMESRNQKLQLVIERLTKLEE